ncbi:MAG: CHASE2 domain-containing protein [Bryobacteraceae bacterium]
MKRTSHRRLPRLLRSGALALALAVCAASATLLLYQTRFFQLIELRAYDSHFLLRPVQPTGDIVLLIVDEESLERIPEPTLFWHGYYAEAIEAAARAGARALGLDIFFAVPVARWEPDHDRRLTEAVIDAARAMPVVCGFAPPGAGTGTPAAAPLYLAASALGMTASLHLRLDPDDFVRRAELMERDSIEAVRSFALRIAEKVLGQEASIDGGRVRFNGRVLPADERGAVLIDFAGPAGTFPRVSFHDFLEASRRGDDGRLRSMVEGRIVLLGFEAASGRDRHATPHYVLRPGERADTAGVEIHASILNMLLSDRYLTQASGGVALLALLLAAAAAAALGLALESRRAPMMLALLLVLVYGFSHFAFRTGLVLPTSQLLAATAMAGTGAVIVRLERRRTLLRGALTLFVGRGAGARIDRPEGVAGLGAARERVTVLFSDICGFSRYCQDRDPGTVLEALNRYFEAMGRIVAGHGGEVNKYVGDGLLAVFRDSDPLSRHPGDHAERAVRCAVEMARADLGFETRFGVHTGEVIVGSVGSAEKLEHTVLGETVNTGARLEAMTREYGVRVLMSGETAALLPETLAVRELGVAEIRGRERPAPVFTPMEGTCSYSS